MAQVTRCDMCGAVVDSPLGVSRMQTYDAEVVAAAGIERANPGASAMLDLCGECARRVIGGDGDDD